MNITPLALASAPPPMYYRDFETSGNVLDVACSLSNEIYAAINRDALIFASIPSIEEMKKGKHPKVVCEFFKSEFTSEIDSLRQLAFINDSVVGVLLDTDNLSRIALLDIQDITQPTLITIVEVYDKIVLLRSDFDYNHLVYETREGTICQVDAEAN